MLQTSLGMRKFFAKLVDTVPTELRADRMEGKSRASGTISRIVAFLVHKSLAAKLDSPRAHDKAENEH